MTTPEPRRCGTSPGPSTPSKGTSKPLTGTTCAASRPVSGSGDRAGVAALLSNLAIVAEYEGDYDRAGALGERALEVRREIGDRWSIGISQNNLGMLATLRGQPRESLERFGESMRLHTEVGDAWMVALGHNNIGNAHRDLGEHAAARASYTRALEAYRRFKDEWALAVLFEDVALLCAASGATEAAWRLVGASDALHDGIGSPRTPDVAGRIEQSLPLPGPAAECSTESLREQGRSLSATELDRLVSDGETAGPAVTSGRPR